MHLKPLRNIVLALASLFSNPAVYADDQGLEPDEQIVHCASSRSRYAFCDLGGPVLSLQLVRKVSASPCVEGSSFGVRGTGIWVDRGCRADFRVVVAELPPDSFVDLHCASIHGRPASCETGFDIADIQILQQVSAAACVRDRSFGFTGTQVWVKNGCRGNFRVFRDVIDIGGGAFR